MKKYLMGLTVSTVNTLLSAIALTIAFDLSLISFGKIWILSSLNIFSLPFYAFTGFADSLPALSLWFIAVVWFENSYIHYKLSGLE